MKKHKSRAPEHDYCKKCDEDFSDEESHLIHKIRSTKHVACPMCGEDFKSEGGRDAHIRQVRDQANLPHSLLQIYTNR